MIRFGGRLALQQRVLPSYRAPFFDLLASACVGGMSLFAGSPRPVEGIVTAAHLQVAHYHPGKNIHLFGGRFYLCYQPGLIDWLEGWDPDALIVEANPRYLSTSAAVKWMHRRGRLVIGWGLGAPVKAQGIGFEGNVWRGFLKQFDGLIAYSQRGADEYAALGFPREKVFVAPNSVSPPPASLPDDRPLTTDQFTNYQFTNYQFTILFVGRLQARKRIDHLLKACAQLGSHPRLVIVGEGPERQNLESSAKEIYPRAEFPGAKHGAELKPYFTEADLFVLPGTGGLAVQEAMSYGLPVIVAQGDGTQDDLVRRENGWQIPPGDFEALVAALREALSDLARLRKMGAASYRIVKEEINIERMAETFVTALNRLTGK